jgi:hypothetical protein
LDIRDVCKELADGLEPPFGIEMEEYLDELQTGLEIIMMEDKLTLEQVRELCWENSADIFDRIYGL